MNQKNLTKRRVTNKANPKRKYLNASSGIFGDAGEAQVNEKEKSVNGGNGQGQVEERVRILAKTTAFNKGYKDASSDIEELVKHNFKMKDIERALVTLHGYDLDSTLASNVSARGLFIRNLAKITDRKLRIAPDMALLIE